IRSFEADPWPRWRYAIDGTGTLEQEILAIHGSPTVALTWRLTGARGPAILVVRPFLSGRDFHALHRENPHARMDARAEAHRVTWQLYPDQPAVTAIANATYRHDPAWYRNFLYSVERERGLDDVEDLASPGELRFDLAGGEVRLVLSTDPTTSADVEAERERRRSFATRLDRSADAYLVKRGAGKTIVAGYPWFADWGRDTSISLRGLCLATGRLDDARDILLAWAGALSEGMLPNRFPDSGEAPEFNSVDASLWFVVAAHELETALRARGAPLDAADRRRLTETTAAIVDGYSRGTRYGIRMDADGLLAAGEPGVALTWMDAKIGDRVVTPRIGKPVEVQALWINALRIAGDARWKKALDSFSRRFWNAERGCLFDVVDADHVAGGVDASVRPNQIFAVGGLPFSLLDGERARRVVDVVESRLLTPLGLRTLDPADPNYRSRYEGGVRERDGAYHQGTVWPWLLGPFVEAWVRVRGESPSILREARKRFLAPLLAHVDVAGIGHVSEIADGDPPHTSRGCPFQAWSLGELLRLDRAVLDSRSKGPRGRRRTSESLPR
ncbi:MAG TPA: amylo-alpha-1,6-glucosidase, partial [Planctomycetota bacterium]|nr:amylo-alpha-1,6-glucosidase [Planctomycetota bacterium]